MSSADQALANMIRNLEEKTGKRLDQWIAIAKNSNSSVHADEADLVEAQYSGAKAQLRPIYDRILREVQKFGRDVEIAPKKAYISLRRKKQFAIVQPSTATRVDLGLNLKGVAPGKRLEESGSFNAMTTHRVRVESVKDVDPELIGWLRQAYEGS